MERPDSLLLGTVPKGPAPDYTALSHERGGASSHTLEDRFSQEEPSAQNHLLDYDEARGIELPTYTPHRTEQDRQNAARPEAQDIPSARLHRSGYILIAVFIYIGLMIFSWAVTCYQSFRPITTKHYSAWYSDLRNDIYGYSVDQIISLYKRNEQWYRAARVVQSIAGVLTIPLTSAVCSSAAVIFIQKRNRELTMRQVMTLADKGWVNISTYLRLLSFFGTNGSQRYGSSFLCLAIFITLLGSVISPLQEIFLSTDTIKIPTVPFMVNSLLDMPDQWANANETDDNLIVLLTRNALASITAEQRQALLWQGANITCARTENDETVPISCSTGGVTFGDMVQLEDPFLAQLPSGYSTGVIQQFMPRINSTSTYEKISSSEFPQACDQIDGAFFVDYYNVTQADGDAAIWGLQACMPANVTQSPWKPTRDRQDFTEELYLNITLISSLSDGDSNETFYRITLNTTAGYFELPNYMNGDVAGPLLEKDPNDICGHACVSEGDQTPLEDDPDYDI